MLPNNIVPYSVATIEKSVDSFIVEKMKRNVNTAINYKNDIVNFFKSYFGKEYNFVTIAELNRELEDIDNLLGYFNGLFEEVTESGKRKNSNATINRKQTSIKQLLKYLKLKKVFKGELVDLEFIKPLPKDTDNIEMIPFDMAIKYAEYFREHEEDRAEEKYLITLLAIDSGLRATELLSLKWGDFTIDEGVVVLRGLGKGNKKWIEKISVDLYNQLETLKKPCVSYDDNVFSLKYHMLANMMVRAKKHFKHDNKKYSFHSFKKTSVNMAYRLTNDVIEAQRKGRHSSLDTTRIYLQEEDYGITGLVSLGARFDEDLYKQVDHATLIEVISGMSKNILFLINHKVNEKLKNKK